MIRTHVRKVAKRFKRSYDTYNRIEISKSALLHNVDFFHEAARMQIIPVIKGNAYGHGIEKVATALKARRLSYVAVDGYFEALKVRAATRQPVLVMGMIKPQNIPKIKRRGFTFVVQDEDTIKAFGALGRPVKVHLELNTGMNRYGIAPTEIGKHLELLKAHPRLRLEGVMTHLADADGNEDKTVDQAVRRFDECVDTILAAGFTPTLFHIGQSAGSLRVRSRHANTIRLGIGLYGINPFPVSHPLHEQCQQLKPAMRLVSTISKINQLEKGDKVSYNYTFTAPKPMTVGVLPLGYHEGVNRALSNKGVVKFGTDYLPIVGRVCMNHTVVDLKNTTAVVGDEVVVYSNRLSDLNSIDGIAARHGLFSYSLLTDLSPDVRRYLVQ